ncbi:CDP-alcohol phosphatidyltransferase family protein [Patescibacteria group bacterium]|nr:CDP-alcohol phosphatidyltransferase family protein [Patescibacteria group bacterium]
MNQSAEKKSDNLEDPKNSRLREVAKKPVFKVVELIDKAFPWLTPNQITALGTTGVLGLTIYTAVLEKKGEIDFKTSVKLLVAFLALSISDALDGGLARHRAKNGDISHDSKTGQLVDTLSDRLQESFLSWLSMYRANERKDKLAMTAALVTTLTNPLSSFFRAWAEANGVVVPEGGKNIFDTLGTRVGKVVASSIKFLPVKKVRGVSVQATIDILVATATIKVAVGRFKAVIDSKRIEDLEIGKGDLELVGDGDLVAFSNKDEEDKLKKQEMIDDAKVRLKWLGSLMVVTGVTTGLLYWLMKKEGNR